MIGEHLGLTISAIAFFLVSFRVLGVADFNTLTALAIVQAGGAVNVALGSALASTSTIASVVLSFVAVRLGETLGRAVHDPDATWKAAPYIWIIPVVVVAQWWVVLLALGTFLMAWRMTVSALRPKSNEPRGEPLGNAERRALLVAAVVPQVLVTAYQPWLPSEVLNVRGERPFTAYVVAETDASVVILRSGKKNRIERIPAADITKRELCSEDQGLLTATTIEVATDSTYRICPEVER